MEFPLFPPLVSHLANPQPPGVYAARFAPTSQKENGVSGKIPSPPWEITLKEKLLVDSGTGALRRHDQISSRRQPNPRPPFLVRSAAYVPEAEDLGDAEEV
jgi:hypothetical protein